MVNNKYVFKFGGASVKNAEAIKNVAKILESHKEKNILVVVSAMGKTTNALEKVVKAYFKQDGSQNEALEIVRKQHYEVIGKLFEEGHEVYDLVNDLLVEIEWVFDEIPEDNYDYIYDQIVSVGELMSSRILAAYLNKIGLSTEWVDARDIILTDDIYREGWVQWEETMENVQTKVKPILGNNGFALTQGFIGSTTENHTTTLGREGSDYTAAIFSHCLDAKSMSIWKDVPGVLTADPRLFKNVTKLDRLSYKEAIEMTYYGAKVIHPKTIKPLQNKSIPLYVKSFIDPESSGTYIATEVGDNYPPMIAVEKDQSILHISTRDFSFVAEQHLSFLFKQIAKYRLQVNLMQNTAISFSICVNDIDDRIAKFSESIKSDYKVVTDSNLELVTVRHSNDETIQTLQKGKIVLLEKKHRNTVQMVMKVVPLMERIEG